MRALTFRVLFTGTTGFRMPDSLRLCRRMLKLAVPADVGAGLDFINLALDDEYGLRNLPFQPRTILDIGANFGLFSLLAAHYCEDARIHAYEPNPRIFPAAAKNLALINATAFQAGIGSRPGFAEILDRGESRLAQTMFAANGTIQIFPLSEAIQRLGSVVDLLKLDCEGAEWDIFLDTQAFQNVRLIRMEYHLTGGRRLDDLQACIKNLGCQIDRLIPNRGFGIAWFSKRDR